MSTTLQFTVEDVNGQMDTYDVIRIYRAASQYGTYSVLDTEALVANTYHYTYEDSGGDVNKFYKYSYYNTSSTVESSLSAPFRPAGTSLQRIRQRALEEFGGGLVFSASAGASTTVTTTDFRLLSSSGYSTSRAKGTWLYKPEDDNPIRSRLVVSYAPTTGIFTVSAAWTDNPGVGDDMEWHYLTDPISWNKAIERACKRHWYLERLPIPGVLNQDEYALSSIAPWITKERQIHDLRYYPGRTSTADDGVDESWGTNGRWWGVKQDRDMFTLQISPAVDTSTFFYLEVSRHAEPLYAEAASPPLACNEEYLAALAYDEVLAYLARPDTGSAQDRARFANERIIHNRTNLARLHRLHRIKPHAPPPRLSSPSVIPHPYRAR
jgi:hypothetical protein